MAVGEKPHKDVGSVLRGYYSILSTTINKSKHQLYENPTQAVGTKGGKGLPLKPPDHSHAAGQLLPMYSRSEDQQVAS